MAGEINPILSVNGVSVPSPSAYTWKLEDISAPNAGRTENGVMQKKRVGQTVGLELSWNGLSTSDLHTLLAAFNPEYVTVVYIDPLSGNAGNNYYKSLVFYVGNRSAPMYNATLGVWQNVSFNIIDKNGAMKT